MILKNNLLLEAARGGPVNRPPVWLMRQAGRVLPEYRAVRKKVKNFRELVTTPELAAEVTIQPVDILGVDAAIIFSDILVIPEAMGLPYEMIEEKGPVFRKTVRGEEDIEKLEIAAGDNLRYVTDAIRIVKKELNGRVPLIGFAGAPWTILAYMVEGHGSKTFSEARKFLYTCPDSAHRLLGKIAKSTVNYLKSQVDAGADILQLFDSWAGILSPAQYASFAFPYLRDIGKEMKLYSPSTPLTVFAKGAFFSVKDFGQTDYDVIGLDWNMDIGGSRVLAGKNKTLQGNMDPALLYADYETIRKETRKMLEAFGKERYIANLGHGLYPDTDKDKVKFFVDVIKGEV